MIGKLAIVAVSAECFNELGIKVRKVPDFKQILMATNSNGNIGYLYSKAAFTEGGYEAECAKNHGFSEDTLDNVIEKIINHLKR